MRRTGFVIVIKQNRAGKAGEPSATAFRSTHLLGNTRASWLDLRILSLVGRYPLHCIDDYVAIGVVVGNNYDRWFAGLELVLTK